jgi:hypothetical protein
MTSLYPEGSKVATSLVYDKKTGAVVHIHQSLQLPGAKPRTAEGVNARALEFAGKASGKKTSEMAALSVEVDQLHPDMRYRVDVKRKVVVATPAPAKRGSASRKRKK